jgi:hypothetical protein
MRIAAGAVLISALMEIDPRFPKVSGEQRRELRKVKEQLEAEAPEGVAPDPLEQRQKVKGAQNGVSGH